MKDKYKILIVEDDEDLNFIMKNKLIKEGFVVEGVKTGKEAINWVKKNKSSLLLLDFNLPDINAKEIIQIISNMNLDIHFVIITGQGDERTAVEMMKKGAKDYIVKDPSFIDFFPTIINKIINEIYREEKLKEAEKALIESEERYRRLVELSPDAIIVLVEDKIVYINSAGLELFHTKRMEDIIGKSLIDFIHENYKDKIYSQINNVQKYSGKHDLFQQKIVCLDDKIIETEAALAPIVYEGKNSIQFVIRDITERIKTKEELVTEKERLSVTLQSISDGMIALDINSKVVLINKIAEKLTGCNHDEAIGKNLDEIFHMVDEKTRTICKNPVEKILKDGIIIKPSSNNLLISKDGKERNIINSAAPIRDKNNKVIGIVLIFKDITKDRRIDEELQKIHKLESLGILAGGIAHDFNNVITGISGNISLAMLSIDSPEEAYKILSDAQSAVVQAKSLSQQLLTFSKGGSPRKKIISFINLLNDTIPFLLRGSNAIYEMNISTDLWAGEVDESQIRQVIANIVINAEQSMPEGGLIKIKAENIIMGKDLEIPLIEGKYVKISIKDEGIGIPKKHLSKIFDPYFTTKQKGTGLGLSTCYSIIKKHYGHISVESVLGKGTTFSIYLPASKEIIEHNDEPQKIKLNIEGMKKILVMDDDDIVRNVIGKMLKYLNFKVDFAIDGVEAIEKYNELIKSNSKYDLVIMDLTVPGSMGGDKAIKELLKIDPNVKAIVSSGYSNKTIMSNYKDYGFSGAIAKPYKIEDLSDIIKQVLNNL